MYEEFLVTGGAGFIGSEVTRLLLRSNRNFKATVFDNFSFGRLSNLSELLESDRERLEIIKGDLTDKTAVQRALKNVNTVIHLAAHAFIPYCYIQPKEFINSNIIGTFNLLTSSAESKIERFVHISTCEVYGTGKYFPMDENHLTRPQSTYAASKLAAENLVYTMHRELGIPAVILRPFNIYGPRDSHPRIIPEVISQLCRGKVLKVGDTSPSRDFSYVSDIATGIIKAATIREAVGEIINLGSGKETTVIEVIDLIADLMNIRSYRIHTDEKKLRPHDVTRSFANIEKAERLINWKPTTSLKDGLRKTIEWYKINGAKWGWEMLDYVSPYSDAKNSQKVS